MNDSKLLVANCNNNNSTLLMDVIRDCSPTRPKLTKISDRHPKIVLENLNQLRKSNDFLCDVVLNVGTSRIKAHKIILCASSPYFRAMFTNELVESKLNEITLKDIDENAMEILIDFCYTSKITIDEKSVQTVLPAACLLQLQEVQDYCAEFLKSQLDPSNCLGIRAFADTHSCQELLKIADKYLQSNFCDVIESDEFLLLPVNNLIEIISNDELNIRCEEQVYQAVMNWVRHDVNERKQFLGQLMYNVRLPLLDTKFLVTKVGTDPLIRQDQICRDLLDEAKDYHLLQEKSLIQGVRAKPRRPIVIGEVLYAVGGWCSGDAIASVEMYDPQISNEWKIVASLSKRRCGVGVGVLNDQIYAIGGHDGSTYLNSTERYDPASNQWFNDVAPTTTCRTSVGVAVLDGYLYAVGGQDGVSCLNIVDKYDPNTNRWSRVASMSTKRLGVAVVVLGNFLYAVGGSDGVSPLNTVERYDPKSNKWAPVASMLTRRKHLGCAVHKNFIYAVGGRDDMTELNSAEKYNPQTNQWQPIVPMKSRRSGVGLAVLNGNLMTIGGFDGTTYLKSCEIYDIETNLWKLSSSMIYRRLGGGVGVVRVQKEGIICSNNTSSSISSSITKSSYPSNQNRSSSATTISPIVYHLGNNSNNLSSSSWPIILSPVPSLLANVPQNQLVNNTPRPAQTPTSTTISIATITSSETIMPDLNNLNSGNNESMPRSIALTTNSSSSTSTLTSSHGENTNNTNMTNTVKLVDI